MKSNLPGFILFIVLVSILASCEKTVDVKPLPYDSKLSIQCMLLPGTAPVLYLNNSVPYFDKKISNRDLFVRGALVTIATGSSIDTLRPDSLLNKVFCQFEYFYKGKVITQSGSTYSLKVLAGSKAFTSTTTTNQSKAAITGVTYVSNFTDVYGEHEGVTVRFTDKPGEENFYRYQLSRKIDNTVDYGESGIHSLCTNGEKFPIQEIGRAVYNDKNKDGLPMSFTAEPVYKHKANDTAYVLLQTMDRESADFFDALDRQKLSAYNPFVEPVFLKTKIEGCIGVFGAYTVSDSVLFVYPE